jgi:chitin synthase
MLLDVGTRPREKALYYLYKAMNNQPNVVGCCGEIVPDKVRCVNFIESA